MGLVKRNKWMMLGTMLVNVTLWIFGERLDISTLAAAMMGISVVLILRVLSWDDCLSEKAASYTLTWFAVFLGMADQLNVQGVIPWFSRRVGSFMKSLAIRWYIELLILQTMYFFIHYLIVGHTTHNGSLYQAFLKMHLTAKFPEHFLPCFRCSIQTFLVHLPITAVVMLQYIMELGILMAFINMTIWGLLGALWWKIIGLY
ncbi:putative solute carrier family 13 [Helianthus annuus]|nr:putative solute carrier family 13 [Helianthus annuus]KAJ0647547.1 putative solute carrier family 13 [Helianthus annuus]